jgi:hypothetical protein
MAPVQQRYDDSNDTTTTTSGDDDGYDNEELIFNTNVTLEGEFDYVFGTESEFGQSLGTVFRNIELVDGGIYVDAEKEKYKLFSWPEMTGFTKAEKYERDDPIEASDANEIITKTYFGNQKRYELIAARAEELVDEDGEVLVEATSVSRTVDLSGSAPSFTDFEDEGGDTVPFSDSITWWSGHEDHGPSTASKSFLTTLTTYSEDDIPDEGDLYNWLPDSSGSNLLRDDLEDRRLEVYMVSKTSENGNPYNQPIVIDTETGARVVEDNRQTDDGGDSGNEDTADDAAYPEPVADFLSQGSNLNLTRDRAENLLTDLIEDESASLTQELVEDSGGRDALIDQVV